MTIFFLGKTMMPPQPGNVGCLSCSFVGFTSHQHKFAVSVDGDNTAGAMILVLDKPFDGEWRIRLKS